MSWRTHGSYKGLSKEAKKWLRRFDRKWDTKAEGRSREDAFDHMRDECSPSAIRPKSQRRRPQLNDLPAPAMPEVSAELELSLLAREIARYTVPKRTQSGWSIHLVLKSGQKLRVRFQDKESANQAFEVIQEALAIFLMG